MDISADPSPIPALAGTAPLPADRSSALVCLTSLASGHGRRSMAASLVQTSALLTPLFRTLFVEPDRSTTPTPLDWHAVDIADTWKICRSCGDFSQIPEILEATAEQAKKLA